MCVRGVYAAGPDRLHFLITGCSGQHGEIFTVVNFHCHGNGLRVTSGGLQTATPIYSPDGPLPLGISEQTETDTKVISPLRLWFTMISEQLSGIVRHDAEHEHKHSLTQQQKQCFHVFFGLMKYLITDRQHRLGCPTLLICVNE